MLPQGIVLTKIIRNGLRRNNMTHYIKKGNRRIVVEIGCYHPEIENNTCPTRKGNCESCRFCKTMMSTEDALFLINEQWKGDV